MEEESPALSMHGSFFSVTVCLPVVMEHGFCDARRALCFSNHRCQSRRVCGGAAAASCGLNVLSCDPNVVVSVSQSSIHVSIPRLFEFSSFVRAVRVYPLKLGGERLVWLIASEQEGKNGAFDFIFSLSRLSFFFLSLAPLCHPRRRRRHPWH